MKHYHNKSALGKSDVKTIIVETGQEYFFDFKSVEMHFGEQLIYQGIKFWLNRCKIIIEDTIVPCDKMIIWYAQEKEKEKKKTKITNDHYITTRIAVSSLK